MNTKTIVWALVMGLVMAGIAFAGANPPVVEENQKVCGPTLQAQYIATWEPYLVDDTDDTSESRMPKDKGIVRLMVKVGDKIYINEEVRDVPACYFFQEANPLGVVWEWAFLPGEIADDWNGGIGDPVILEEKDVSNFAFVNLCESCLDCTTLTIDECPAIKEKPDGPIIFPAEYNLNTCNRLDEFLGTVNFMLSCDVKITFIEPKK